MQCKACGTETPSESVFCPKCGERLNEEAGAAGSQAAEADSPADRFLQGTRDSRPGELAAETPLWEGNYSGKAMLGSWILAGLLTLALIVGAALIAQPYGWWALLVLVVVIWGGLGLTLAYRKLAVHYRLTPQRFLHDKGIFVRRSDRIETIDIDDVTCEQGLVQRFLNVGTIRVSSSDRSHPELVLPGIDDVRRVADLIDDARRQERLRRGLHVESI
jgi:membrane protein YdbS with pleckstrin-like domain